MPTFTVTSEKPVVVIDQAEYQELQDRMERLEFLVSRSLKKDIIEARRELREGKTTSHTKLKSQLLEN